jgi:2-aminoadipate transaminase
MSPRFARRMDGVHPSVIGELLRHGADPGVISFAGGYPDPGLFPIEGLRAILDDLLLERGPEALQYGLGDGTPSLKAHVARRMVRDGVPCSPDDVLILQGAQQGLDLVAKMVVDPGDVIVTEDPTFMGALVAFAPYEPAYAPVRTDDDGMDPDDLERVLARTPAARLLYVMPDFQNPTGATLALDRRRRILELADRHDLVVLEDSPYRDLRYEGESLPTLRSLDRSGRVVYLGSFSKILAPGMRLGWAVASEPLLGRLGLLKIAADTQVSTVNQVAASLFMDRFDLDEHIGTIRAAYRRKRDLMLEAFEEWLPAGVTWTVPDGGLFTWLTFPEGFDATAFMRDRLLPEARVAFVPGESFYPVRGSANRARMNFSGASETAIREGVRRLGGLLHAVLDA